MTKNKIFSASTLALFFIFCLSSTTETRHVKKPAEALASETDSSIKQSQTNNTSKPKAKWLIMLYMQARNNLASVAGENLRAIASSLHNNSVIAVAQCDQPGKKGAWRYRAHKNQVSLEDYSDIVNAKDPEGKLVDFVCWAKEAYEAEKYFLIIWNHGSGAVAPAFGDPLRMFLQNRDLFTNSTNINISGLLEVCAAHEASITNQKQDESQQSSIDPHNERNILFDEENRVFLSNDGMGRALERITGPECLGQPLECIGFDACYMSMLEIAYQVKNHAKVMVGSEELELARGWFYKEFIPNIAQKKNGQELAKDIVRSYEKYYKTATQYYTQSALDLQKIDGVKNSFESFIDQLERCLILKGIPMVSALRKARQHMQQYSVKFYVDLNSMYQNIIEKVLSEKDLFKNALVCNEENLSKHDKAALITKGLDAECAELVDRAKFAMKKLEECVIDNVCSSFLSGSKGLSIYFPFGKNIDASYQLSDFARSSKWPNMLKIIGQLLHP